jgi:zinc finger BED domain-containing protein 5/7/8/9
MILENLETDTRGESVFRVLKEYFIEHKIPFHNILSCACDGAPALTGCHRGFLAYLKAEVPSIITVHCVLHRHNLVAKKMSTTLHQTLAVVIRAVNYIKANSLRDRIFQQLCEEDEVHSRLLLYTEVRWLSRGTCLTRVVELFEVLLESVSEELRELLQPPSAHRQISYMADVFSRMNDANKQLQGKGVTLIDSKRVMSSLIDKLELFRQNLVRRSFVQFPLMNASIQAFNEQPDDDELQIYTDHLQIMLSDMKVRSMIIIHEARIL